MKKAHILWEQGVAVGQIAQRCGLTRQDILNMAKSLGWTPRDPERLAARKNAPLDSTAAIVRRAIAGLQAEARSIFAAIAQLREMLADPTVADPTAGVYRKQKGAPRKIDAHTVTVVHHLWNAGMPTCDIGRRFGVTDQTIRKLARAQGWPRRKVGGGHPNRPDAGDVPIRRVPPGVSGIPE